MDEMVMSIELFKTLIANKKVIELRKIFEEFNAVDIAEIASSLDETELLFIFKTVPPDSTAEVFTYLDAERKENLVSALSGEQLGHMMEFIYSDDIVDFMEEMPSNLVRKILKSAHKDKRYDINSLLNYLPNSAGSLMTTEYIEIEESDTCIQAIEKIRKYGKEAETISYLYIVDEKRKLIGSIYLKEVLLSDDDVLVSNIMDTNFISVKTSDDQEAVATTFKKYDINTIPVTTDDGHLVGIITVDDILDVIEEEATEDIQKMGAVSPLSEEYLKTSVMDLAKKRVVWLLVLMISATFTAMIINNYEILLVQLPVLSIFLPMLMNTGGNAGAQTNVLVIRALALNTVIPSDYFRVLKKELGVALIAGSILSVVAFAWIVAQFQMGLITSTWADTLDKQILVAISVSISLYFTVLFSKATGSTLPIVAKKFKLDPALMSGPLVTTIVDALSLTIYFFVASRILVNYFH